MRIRCLVCVTFVVLAFGWTPRATAEDHGHFDPSKPSPLAGLGAQQLSQETTPTDAIEYLRAFREWVAKHKQPDAKTRKDRGLLSLWKSALGSRAPKMVQNIDRLTPRKYWLPEFGPSTHARPDAWPRMVRHIASLMTQLHGAWKQYSKAQDKLGGPPAPATPAPQPHTPGAGAPPPGTPPHGAPPPSGYAGYAHPGVLWRAAMKSRQALGNRRGRLELLSYWNLLRRYQAGWAWRVYHCENCAPDATSVEKRDAVTNQRRRMVHTKRDTLEQQMLALQVLTGAMQAQEEHALLDQLSAMRNSAQLRKPVMRAVNEMRDARLNAERYVGDSSSRYGHLLRAWVRAYRAGILVFQKAAPAASGDAGPPPGGGQPPHGGGQPPPGGGQPPHGGGAPPPRRK